MKHTKEMLAAVLSELEGVDPGDEDAEKAAIADGLDVALADFELPPFVLSELEEARVRAYEHQSASVGQNELAAIVRRAQCMLAPVAVPGPFALSEAELELMRRWIAGGHAKADDYRIVANALGRAQRTLGATAQAGGVWSEADYLRAEKAFAREGGPYPDHATIARLRTALDGVAYRLDTWDADQVVGIAELLEQLDISDQFLSNPAVWKALLANYVEARSKTPEHAADIRGNCGLAGVSGEPAQAGGEWTEADYERANDAFYDRRPSFAEREPFSRAQYPRIVAALDAVKHRLAAPAVEPLSDELRQDAESLHSNWGDDPASRVGRVAGELLRRCSKPAPKQRTAEELRTLIVDGHRTGSEWTDIVDELVALAKRAEASK